MLKHARLYKDANGQVWHIKSDGTAMKYPQFEEYSEAPKGAYEEIPCLGRDVSDDLFLAQLHASSFTKSYICAVLQYNAENKEAGFIFDVLKCKWITADYMYELFPVANFKRGAKYMVRGHEATFDFYSSSQDGFYFTLDEFKENQTRAFVKVHQICCVKEVPKMPKMFEVWKDDNGETKGRDCKTGREFLISEYTFDTVEDYSKAPKIGDTVYINSNAGVCPHEIFFVQDAARRLPESKDDILLYYAYGHRPTPTPVETDKTRWIVEYTRGLDRRALICGRTAGFCNMRLVVNKDCLTIVPPESDSKDV